MEAKTDPLLRVFLKRRFLTDRRLFSGNLDKKYRVDSNLAKVPLANGISTSRSINFELGFGVCLDKIGRAEA